MTEIKAEMRVRLPEQLGSAEGITKFKGGSDRNWAVYVPGPKHPDDGIDDDGFLVYCPPEWLTPIEGDMLTKLRAAFDRVEETAKACSATDWRMPEVGYIVDRDVDGWRSIPDGSRIFSYCDDRQAEAIHALNHDPDTELRVVAAHREILALIQVLRDDYQDNVADGLTAALAKAYRIEVQA